MKYFIYILAVLLIASGTGIAAAATDINGDGLYEDLNDNGRMDFGDVVILFNHLSQFGSAPELIEMFDFNGNDRMDFGDVVQLFNDL